MSSYVLKINSSPITIDRVGLDKIKSELIPYLLQKAFGGKSTSFSYRFDDSIFDLHNDPEYRALLAETAMFRTMYSKVLNHYKEHGDFSYTKDFLSTIDNLKRKRKRLEQKYPIVRHAYHISNESARANASVELVGQIGTGVDHLTKMSKLELFVEARLEKTDDNNGSTTFDYQGNELITMPSSSPLEMCERARIIEMKINRSLPSEFRRIEQVHINPVFNKIVLLRQKALRIDLDIVVDYPNGDPDIEYEAMALELLKRTGSRSATIALNGADPRSVEENIQSLARNGYLRDVITRGGTMVDYRGSSYKTCGD